jgi:thiol-disulfide isomerase/thioredoxin
VKRIGLVLGTLLGIVAFAVLANRATRIPVTRAVSSNQDNKPTASPDFTLKDLEDHVSLSQFNGKVVLVNFWATGCGPESKSPG